MKNKHEILQKNQILYRSVGGQLRPDYPDEARKDILFRISIAENQMELVYSGITNSVSERIINVIH
jgi:hypothetical protein